jgi:hypothetical protein
MNPNSEGFSAAARAFKKGLGPKLDLLTPHLADIVLLRKRGVSFPVIVTLLRQSGVEVSGDTVRRFCSYLPNGEPSMPTLKSEAPC